MANTRIGSNVCSQRSKCATSARASVFVLKSRDGMLERTSTPWATHVAVPSEDYAAYLRRRSWRKKNSSIEPRWGKRAAETFLWKSSEPFYLRFRCKHILVAIKQPGGWIIERKRFRMLGGPPETLTTKLDGLPVVFSTLELAALVAESKLMAVANLSWATETCEIHTMSA